MDYVILKYVALVFDEVKVKEDLVYNKHNISFAASIIM